MAAAPCSISTDSVIIFLSFIFGPCSRKYLPGFGPCWFQVRFKVNWVQVGHFFLYFSNFLRFFFKCHKVKHRLTVYAIMALMVFRHLKKLEKVLYAFLADSYLFFQNCHLSWYTGMLYAKVFTTS